MVEVELNTINITREADLKAQWKIQTEIHHMNIRKQIPGKKSI